MCNKQLPALTLNIQQVLQKSLSNACVCFVTNRKGIGMKEKKELGGAGAKNAAEAADAPRAAGAKGSKSENASQLDWPACATEGLDRRTRRTRKALFQALLSLLQEKPLNAITVTELTDLADVNRATFYTHYQDIFDMFDHLKSDLCETCRKMVNSHGEEIALGEYDGLVANIFHFFEQNEALFSIVFAEGADNSFYISLIEVVREACLHNVKVQQTVKNSLANEGTPKKKLDAASQTVCNYQFDYIAGGVVSILRNWMLSGRKESADEMTFLTSNLIKCLHAGGIYGCAVESTRELAGRM